ncbi:hypothetical protein, partial [Pseudomonas cannabina]|uniref:hypothetical protein n=1 Tax=Pseudomonas cannabina TaxID=86840 RepID=UPI001C3F482A
FFRGYLADLQRIRNFLLFFPAHRAKTSPRIAENHYFLATRPMERPVFQRRALLGTSSASTIL